MILTLRIDKIEPGNYRAQVFDGREELGEFGAPGGHRQIHQLGALHRPSGAGGQPFHRPKAEVTWAVPATLA